MQGRVNLERLHEASDEALASAYSAALERAHNAPLATFCLDHDGHKHLTDHKSSFAMFSREAFRLGNEISRRALAKAGRSERQ